LLWEATIQLLGLRYDKTDIERWRDDMATLEFSKTDLAQIFRQEGQAEGRVEGRVEEARESVLAIGNKRLGAPPANIANTIGSITDLKQLHDLRERVLDITSWHELLKS
jgi:hypothetical protein